MKGVALQIFCVFLVGWTAADDFFDDDDVAVGERRDCMPRRGGGNRPGTGNRPGGTNPRPPGGGRPSGNFPPGTGPSGDFPPGTGPSGDFPPGTGPSGDFPPGTGPPGGNPPSGGFPPGEVPPGRFPPGGSPPGGTPPGSIPPGRISRGGRYTDANAAPARVQRQKSTPTSGRTRRRKTKKRSGLIDRIPADCQDYHRKLTSAIRDVQQEDSDCGDAHDCRRSQLAAANSRTQTADRAGSLCGPMLMQLYEEQQSGMDDEEDDDDE